MKRDHFTLEQAAKILNCTEDYLIYLGTHKSLPILALTVRYNIHAEHVPSQMEGSPQHNFCLERKKHMKLAKLCLLEIEAGKKDAAIFLDRETWYESGAPILGQIHPFIM